MDSPDRNSQGSEGEIQGSPIFNFLCSLSPIKPVKSSRVPQTYSEISFPPPPAVFVSPGAGAQKSRSDGPQSVPEIAHKDVKHAFVNASQRAQRVRSVRKVQKPVSYVSPCTSPSKLLEEYLAVPVEDEFNTEDGNLEISRQGENVSTDDKFTPDARGSNGLNKIHSNREEDNGIGMDIHQEADGSGDLEFLMTEDVDEHQEDSPVDQWHSIELSAEQVEGYIASLRDIVEEQGICALSANNLQSEGVTDPNLPENNLEPKPDADGSRVAVYKTSSPHQRVIRRRCLDFKDPEGELQIEPSTLSLESPSRQAASGGGTNKALLVLKKRVSATLSGVNRDSMGRIDISSDDHSWNDVTGNINMARTTVNIKFSRNSLIKDAENSSCLKSSPVATCRPSGIGLHLNSLTSSMTCTKVREIDGAVRSITSVRSGSITAGGLVSSKIQGGQAETPQKLLPLNPGKHLYAGAPTESRQSFPVSSLETRLNDCEAISECLDQDRESSKSAVCVHPGPSAIKQQVQDVTPSNGLNKRPSPLGRKRMFLQDAHYQVEMEGVEDNNQSPYSPKKKRRSSSVGEKSGDGCKRCNCKKSKCLKLYCECFAAGVYCVDSCTCQGCFNKPEFEETVMDTRQQIESRNPLAFAPKIIRAAELSPSKKDESRDTPASARHKRGCNCKKSHCLKKYCECFQAGVGCSEGCRCENCKNVHGRKEGSFAGSQDFENNEYSMESLVSKEVKDEHAGKSEHCVELIHGSQNQGLDLSPITPAFQHGSQNRFVNKSSLSIKKRGALEALRSPALSMSTTKPCQSPSLLSRSPSRLLRSCKGTQNSPPTGSSGVPLPKSSTSPVSTPRILRIGQFSPRWDGLDDICTLTPGLQAPLRPTPTSTSVLDRADLSPSVEEQPCNDISSTGNCSLRQSARLSRLTSPMSQQHSSQCLTPANTEASPQTQTPCAAVCDMDNKFAHGNSNAYTHQLMEDDGTADILKESDPECLPACLLSSSSPKHKRVSPPHHHALREGPYRGLQSPGIRNSRKFILQSVPSVPTTPLISVYEKHNGSKSHD
ncbi:hypothetical protein KP509_37G017200 [Ceratopteris richardii]|uniref:CRC domain-containing protein n=1 Tax=Ceratopteris richardii TaxID=49495 RepID=A0A8T2Q6X4_CERRI|nr:hypothetical protein KP509_37G017200 [Ceratopteris richardii]KAH7279380.1 hypothetical protein KP509_37G017200 [Ceratopteris richardii]